MRWFVCSYLVCVLVLALSTNVSGVREQIQWKEVTGPRAESAAGGPTVTLGFWAVTDVAKDFKVMVAVTGKGKGQYDLVIPGKASPRSKTFDANLWKTNEAEKDWRVVSVTLDTITKEVVKHFECGSTEFKGSLVGSEIGFGANDHRSCQHSLRGVNPTTHNVDLPIRTARINTLAHSAPQNWHSLNWSAKWAETTPERECCNKPVTTSESSPIYGMA
jgi:hypothetical protein